MKPQKFCCVTEVGKFYVDVYEGVVAKFRGLNHRISRNIKDPISLKAYIQEYLRELGTGRWIQMYEVPCYPNPLPNIDIKRSLADAKRLQYRQGIWARRRQGQYEVLSMWTYQPHAVCIFLDILHNDIYFNPATDHRPKEDLDLIAKEYPMGIFSYRSIFGDWASPIPVVGVTYDEKEIPCDLIVAEDFRSFELSTKRRFKYFQADEFTRDYFYSDTSPESWIQPADTF